MEVWKAVKGYEGLYEASTEGRVRSLDRKVNTNIRFNDNRIVKGRVLKPHIKQNGYYVVSLCKNGTIAEVSVHRLIAETFIPNPKQVRVVNHKNGIKTDNRVDNLEWMTYKENHWHARETGLLTEIGRYQCKRVRCVETGQEFDSAVEAADWLLSISCPRVKAKDRRTIGKNIRQCIGGHSPRAYGYHWVDV